MSSIEDRLTRDIASVTRGVVVTDADLIEARRSVDERTDVQRRQHHRRTIASVAAGVLVVAGGGFLALQTIGGTPESAPPANTPPDVYVDFLKGEAPTPQNIDGYWRVDGGNTMVSFNEDGTVQFSNQGAVISGWDAKGTYTIDGDEITVDLTRTLNTCVLDESFAMRAGLPDAGLLNLVIPGERLGTCDDLASTITLEHVLPTGSTLAELDNTGLRGWQPLTKQRLLYGDWMAEGGGYLLEIARDGRYYVVHESTDLVDEGTWTLTDSALTLTSSAQSATCRRGDRLSLADPEYADVGTAVVRGTVAENTCPADWKPERWIRIPDASASAIDD